MTFVYNSPLRKHAGLMGALLVCFWGRQRSNRAPRSNESIVKVLEGV